MPVFPPNVIKELSSDQRYLYEICHAIQIGNLNPSLAMKKPGTLNHARFINTAARILRHYVSVEIVSTKLRILVNFIMKIYAPMWFSIKREKSFRMGPKHIFDYIKLTRDIVPYQYRKLIFDVIENNGYFAHAENVLLTMLTDEDVAIRKKAIDLILEKRKTSIGKNIRKFIKPVIDFKANSYHQMVHFEKCRAAFDSTIFK